jgi:putative nucleotidyltransferase with HDIG domain
LDADVLVDNRVILRKGKKVTPELLIRLRAQNIARVYTSSALLAERIHRSAALAAEAREILSGDAESVARRYGIAPRRTPKVMDAAYHAVAESFAKMRGCGKLDLDAVRSTARALMSDFLLSGGAVKLGDLPASEEYAPHHAVNVALFMFDALRDQEEDSEELEATVLGGLLHDVGETRIREEILGKVGTLTQEEYSTVKQHPALGAQILRDAGAEEATIAVALRHHEKHNGTGYPAGLRGAEIPFAAQVASVCDVYDALTTTRAYRGRFEPACAMSVIVQSSGSHFSPEAVQLLSQKVGAYPVGTCVRLSNEQVALVARPNESHVTQPLVRVVASLKEGKVAEPFDVDLASVGISIKEVISI